MSIFLSFAATYPDMEVMLYFILPIKIKWMGLLYGAFLFIDIYDAFKQAKTIGIYINAIIITVVTSSRTTTIIHESVIT